MSLSEVGGWGTLVEKLPATHFDLTNMGWSHIFQYFLLYCLGLVVSQDIWQRVFTGKNEKVLKQGSIAAGVYSIAYAVAISMVGMCGVLFFPNVEDPQTIFAMISLKILPAGALGIVLAAVCAALMSTASGAMLASATLITNDLLKPLLKETTEKKLPFALTLDYLCCWNFGDFLCGVDSGCICCLGCGVCDFIRCDFCTCRVRDPLEKSECQSGVL